MWLFFFIQPPSGNLRFLSHKQTQLTDSSVLCDRTWQAMAHRPNLVHHLFLYSQELRMGFTSLKLFLRNIQKRVIFYDTCKLWHSNFNVHKRSFIGSIFSKIYWNGHSHLSLKYFYGCFLLWWQSWEAATELYGPQNLKYLSANLQGMFAGLCCI